jgi:hypothetical protein
LVQVQHGLPIKKAPQVLFLCPLHFLIFASRAAQNHWEVDINIKSESLSRFERGRLAELDTRKLLAVLAILGMELDLIPTRQSGMLDELRIERAQAKK